MKNLKLYIWRVLEGIAIVITIFITPAALYFQYQSLQEQKILGAWQLITTKASGNSGKIQALEFLNSKGVPLVGVDLSNAYLSGVNLKGAILLNADFTGANVDDANFTGAFLDDADFTGAYLWSVNLKGADCTGANFEGAFVYSADDLPIAPKGYEFLRSKTPPKDGKIYIELIKKQSIR